MEKHLNNLLNYLAGINLSDNQIACKECGHNPLNTAFYHGQKCQTSIALDILLNRLNITSEFEQIWCSPIKIAEVHWRNLHLVMNSGLALVRVSITRYDTRVGYGMSWQDAVIELGGKLNSG